MNTTYAERRAMRARRLHRANAPVREALAEAQRGTVDREAYRAVVATGIYDGRFYVQTETPFTGEAGTIGLGRSPAADPGLIRLDSGRVTIVPDAGMPTPVILPGLPDAAWGAASSRVGKPEMGPDGTVTIPYRMDFAVPAVVPTVDIPFPAGTTREEAEAIVNGIIADIEAEEAGEPTDEGRRRYPDGRYEDIPCTCAAECPEPCKGSLGGCGCEACGAAYGDGMDDGR